VKFGASVLTIHRVGGLSVVRESILIQGYKNVKKEVKISSNYV
jgi:hypothetical protein